MSADILGRIAGLTIYPIKSCAGLALDEVRLTATGLERDRGWMLVDESGSFITQRDEPTLALVQPDFDAAGDRLLVGTRALESAPARALSLPVNHHGAPVVVRLWGDEVPAFDAGDDAARWFHEFLSRDPRRPPERPVPRCRLVRFDAAHRRLSSLRWTGGVEALNLFSDGYPILVLGQSSVDDLNARLTGQGHRAVDARRFRPNVLIAGFEAHDEDRVGALTVAGDSHNIVLTPVKPCPRCPIPNIDPDTALSAPWVGDALQRYRQDPRVDGAVSFGMNAIVSGGDGQILRVGQAVTAALSFD